MIKKKKPQCLSFDQFGAKSHEKHAHGAAQINWGEPIMNWKPTIMKIEWSQREVVLTLLLRN